MANAGTWIFGRENKGNFKFGSVDYCEFQTGRMDDSVYGRNGFTRRYGVSSRAKSAYSGDVVESGAKNFEAQKVFPFQGERRRFHKKMRSIMEKLPPQEWEHFQEEMQRHRKMMMKEDDSDFSEKYPRIPPPPFSEEMPFPFQKEG